MLLLFFSLHSSSPIFKLLSMASYGGELLLDSSSPWSGISNHLSSFSILLSLNFKKQRTPLMKKIQGLKAPYWATSCNIKNIFIQVMFFCFLYLFVRSIHFNLLFFILFSMYIVRFPLQLLFGQIFHLYKYVQGKFDLRTGSSSI